MVSNNVISYPMVTIADGLIIDEIWRNGHLVGWLFQPTFCINESIYKLLFISFIQSIMIMQCSFKL